MAKLKNKSESEAACWHGAAQVMKLLRQRSPRRTKDVVREAVARLRTLGVNHSARNPVISIESRGIGPCIRLGFLCRPQRGFIEITEEGQHVARMSSREIISMLLADHARHSIRYATDIVNDKELSWIVDNLEPISRQRLFKALTSYAGERI